MSLCLYAWGLDALPCAELIPTWVSPAGSDWAEGARLFY